jgi:hypothetical protein
MNDISVQEIIATFKNVNRKDNPSAKNDHFLDLIKKKEHWTIQEYKDFSLAYNLEYMSTPLKHMMAINFIEKKYKFESNWNDYLNVIDNIKSISKQKKYINYYIWYYHCDMNEEFYKQLMSKPYFNLLKPDSKVNFLKHYIKVGKSNAWINDYFTSIEIANALKRHSFDINIRVNFNSNKFNQEDGYKEKITQVKDFYNRYESFMDNKIKLDFFNHIIETGAIDLIKFLYEDKGIKKLNKLKLLWHVCSDTGSSNTLEILNCLKEIGVNFTPKDLKNSQKHQQWFYMERTDELLYIFQNLEKEKNYNGLNKSLRNKNVQKQKLKI